MQLPAKLRGLGTKIEVMRSGVNFAKVLGGKFDEASWRTRTRRVDLVELLIELRLDQATRNDRRMRMLAIRNAVPNVSRLLTGRRQVNLGQLNRLARHFGLVGVVGDEAEAVSLLCDDVPLEVFEQRLVQSDWRAAHQPSPYSSRGLLLAEFERAAPLTPAGLSIRTEPPTTSHPHGSNRGAEIPELPLPDGELFECALGTRVKFRLEMEAPRGVILFEIRPSAGGTERYQVVCLAPSLMMPDTTVEPSRGVALVPPLQPGNPRECFVLKGPVGRQDVVAVVSRPPIPVPWPTSLPRLYEPSASELHGLLRGIADARRKHTHAIEIRHFPYRIVDDRA